MRLPSASDAATDYILSLQRMPAFDLRTVLLMSAVMPGLMALVMFSLGRSLPRNIRGVGHWAQGALIVSVAVVLLSLRGSIPDWLSVIAGNLCMVGSIGVWLLGSQRFFGRQSSWRLIVLLLIVDAVGLTLMTWIYPTAEGRSLCTNVILALLYGLQAHVMLRYGRHDRSSLFVGMMFLIQTITTILRVATSFGSAMAKGGLYAGDLIQVIYLGCGALMSLTVTVGFMLVAMNRLRVQLERQSHIDPLTGLLNRRAFVQAHADGQQALTRKGGELSLLLIDIDHFKNVNDTYGHSTGDEILVDFSRRAAAMLPPETHLARWGGEEFATLLPGYGQREAMKLADDLRKLIASGASTSLPRYTCSIGIACLESREATVEELVRNADEALYRAKRNGRNCIACAEEAVTA